MDVSISAISYQDGHMQTNQQNAQNNPRNSQQLLKALSTLTDDHKGFLPLLCADLRRFKGGAR